VVQGPFGVVHAEQQGAEPVAALVDPVPRDHALGVAAVLELEHHPLVGPVGAGRGLGDDAVEARAFEPREPVLGLPAVRRDLGGEDARQHASRRRCEDRLEEPAPLGEGAFGHVVVADREHIEGHERRRGLLREHLHAGRGGVDALLEVVEVEALVAGQHDLAVDDAAIRQRGRQHGRQFGEVARERALVPRAQLDLVTVAEHDAAEAVPLRLEEHVAGREGVEPVDRLRQHRPDRWHERQAHADDVTGGNRGPPLDVQCLHP
jgi:hypothetical protein